MIPKTFYLANRVGVGIVTETGKTSVVSEWTLKNQKFPSGQVTSTSRMSLPPVWISLPFPKFSLLANRIFSNLLLKPALLASLPRTWRRDHQCPSNTFPVFEYGPCFPLTCSSSRMSSPVPFISLQRTCLPALPSGRALASEASPVC